jgi:predicted GNAT family acetyltransferase
MRCPPQLLVDVELVLTHPSVQRRGSATQLVAHVARTMGRDRPLYLDSCPYAVELYERLGFVRQRFGAEDDMVPMVRFTK